KKRRLKKRVYILLFIFIILLGALAYGAYLYFEAQSAFTDSYENDGREKSSLREEAVNPKLDNVSVLIMGVDSSEEREQEGPGRTDEMIFATLNKDSKSVNLSVFHVTHSYTYLKLVMKQKLTTLMHMVELPQQLIQSKIYLNFQ